MAMNYVTFNQDHSHLAIGTSRGFRIYMTEPFAKCSEMKTGDIAIVEMLFSTSLVALVLSPRRLQIINTKRERTICELTFPTAILAVRLNRKRLVVILEDQIYLYDISNMKLLATIETSPNPQAICALSPSSEKCFLAYPLPQKTSSAVSQPSHAPPSGTHVPPSSGDVLIYDTDKQETTNVIAAHKSPLSAIQINNTGTIIATASDKGTIIRVFGLPNGDKLYQFRRGSIPARIFSMAFNTTSSLLCVSSATDTVHVFKLGGAQRRPSVDVTGSANDEAEHEASPTGSPSLEDGPAAALSRKHDGTLFGILRRTSQNVGASLATSVGQYLPSSVAEMWEPTRDFAWCRLPKQASNNGGPQQLSAYASSTPGRCIVAMSNNNPQVFAVTSEGQFIVYDIDLEKGGEGTLVRVSDISAETERTGLS